MKRLALALLVVSTAAGAQVPVGIVTNPLGELWHNAQLQQALATVKQLKSSYDQFQMYYGEMRGITGLGSFLNSGISSAMGLPPDFAQIYNGVNMGGYYGLTSAADAAMNPAGMTSTLQTGVIPRAYADAMANKTMEQSVANALQSNGVTLGVLQKQIDLAPTMKQTADLQARASFETAQGVNTATKLQALDMLQRNEKDIAAAQRDAIGQRAFATTNRAIPSIGY